MGTHSRPGSKMHTRLLLHCLVILSFYTGYIRGDSDDLVEGSGDDDDQSLAITQAVKKVAELVDEVASDLNENIDNLEVNLEENEIKDEMKTKKKRNKKCKKCVKRVFRARNSALCKQCDDENDAEEETTANTTPASTTPTTTSPSTTSSDNLNNKRIQKIKERCEKCHKKNFRARNADFCDSKCVTSDEIMDTTENVTNNFEVTTEEVMEA